MIGPDGRVLTDAEEAAILEEYWARQVRDARKRLEGVSMETLTDGQAVAVAAALAAYDIDPADLKERA